MSRRVWFARDAWLTADPKVEVLGCKYGAEGVLAFEEILAVAKITNDAGRFEVMYGQLVKRALIRKAKTAPAIIALCADLGLVELSTVDDLGVAGKVAKWTRWNDPRAAERAARKRAKENGAVTEESR